LAQNTQPEEPNERALQAPKLNNAVSQDATSKPTIRLERFSFNGPGSFKLKGASSSLREQKEKQKKP
jgi:hypothetical protein